MANLIGVRFTFVPGKPCSAHVVVEQWSNISSQGETPVLSSECVSLSEVEYYLQQLEKDIAAIRQEVSRKLGNA